MAHYFLEIVKVFVLLFCLFSPLAGSASGAEKASITLLTLGSSQCVSCQLEGTILNRLRDDYSGKVVFSYIDVKANRGQARAFRLRKIPTLIFYDGQLHERYRHEGFLGREGIVKMLDQLIVLDSAK